MTDLRTAAQQALEALESCQDGDYTTGDVLRQSFDEQAVNAAIVALWAALSQEQAEPWACSNKFSCRCSKNFVKEQAEPVQEPVAWRHKSAGHFTVNPLVSKFPEWEPLYTAPPQRKPLTEGVLMGVYIDFDRAADPAWSKVEYLLQFARAIERAHRIGDNT